MLRLILFTAVLATAANASHAQPSTPEPMTECEVIARVNGQVVTACEVLWQVNLMIEDKLDRIPPEELPNIKRMLMQRTLMSMLDMKMLYADFRRKAPEADLAAIHENLAKTFDEKELPSLMERVGVEQPAELEPRLVELGTSLREQRADFYQTMIAKSWINESVEVKREVTHDELLDYYNEHAADYAFPTQAKWEELMIRFDRSSSKADAYRRLAEIGNRAYRTAVALPDKTRPAFAEIAKAESQGFSASSGGQHGWTTQGSLADQQIDDALFRIPVGEMSPILESGVGFHIVRVTDRREAGRTPFTEVQQEIREKIIRGRTDVAFAARLDELRRECRIWTVFDGYLDSNEYADARAGKTKQR